MDFYQKTNKFARKAHSHLTREFTVYQYAFDSDGASNEYADGDWNESSSTVQASIRSEPLRDDQTAADGDDVPADAEIFVSADAVAVSIGTDDESRATEFVDEQTGRRYKAMDYHDEGSLVSILCMEVDG